MVSKLNTTGDTSVSIQEESDEQQEVIEVQILHKALFTLNSCFKKSAYKITWNLPCLARQLEWGHRINEHEPRPRAWCNSLV